MREYGTLTGNWGSVRVAAVSGKLPRFEQSGIRRATISGAPEVPTSSPPGRDVWAGLAPPLQAAVEEAWSAYCAGSLPHGAVIADAQGRVLVRGRNCVYQQEAGSPSGPLYGHPLAHAEVNALLALDYNSVDVRSCVLYATTEPCPLCIGALVMAGVRELRYAARDTYGGATSWLASPLALVTSRQIRVVGPEQPTLEAIIMALRVEFLLHQCTDTERAVLLAEILPHAAQLAETLFGAGELERLCGRGATAAEMVGRLAAMLPPADPHPHSDTR
jgi:tRNA(adenine34) deaminase